MICYAQDSSVPVVDIKSLATGETNKTKANVEYRFIKSSQAGVQSVYAIKPEQLADSLEYLCEIPCKVLVDSENGLRILIRRDLSAVPRGHAVGILDKRIWLQDQAGSHNEVVTVAQSKIDREAIGVMIFFALAGGAIDYSVWHTYNQHNFYALQLAGGLAIGSWIAIAPNILIWDARYKKSDFIRVNRIKVSAMPLLSTDGHVGAAVVGQL